MGWSARAEARKLCSEARSAEGPCRRGRGQIARSCRLVLLLASRKDFKVGLSRLSSAEVRRAGRALSARASISMFVPQERETMQCAGCNYAVHEAWGPFRMKVE